jgi:hypothetical protein
VTADASEYVEKEEDNCIAGEIASWHNSGNQFGGSSENCDFFTLQRTLVGNT